jgi:hypothetical protein
VEKLSRVGKFFPTWKKTAEITGKNCPGKN